MFVEANIFVELREKMKFRDDENYKTITLHLFLGFRFIVILRLC